MSPQLAAFLILLLLSLAVPIILFFPLHLSLRNLLERTVRLPAGVTFYVRSFALILFISAISAAIGTSFDDVKAGARFMEYVWKVADGLSSSIQLCLLLAVVYLVVISILVATLKVKND
jgi:hypothetical protein